MRVAIFRNVVLTLGCLVSAAIAGADTLVLRDGRQLRGDVISVDADTIEFREQRGRSSRTIRLNRDEVARIDFDRSGYGQGFAESESRGDARPSGMREREVVVSGDVAWNDAGIDVRAGQVIYFTAIGRVNWGPGRRHGPAGESGSPRNPNRPMPNRPAAALIAKVGSDSTDYVFIGDTETPIRIRASGRLYLGVNDDFLGDNSGNFRVTVYY